jgi:hypothetical protein
LVELQYVSKEEEKKPPHNLPMRHSLLEKQVHVSTTHDFVWMSDVALATGYFLPVFPGSHVVIVGESKDTCQKSIAIQTSYCSRIPRVAHSGKIPQLNVFVRKWFKYGCKVLRNKNTSIDQSNQASKRSVTVFGPKIEADLGTLVVEQCSMVQGECTWGFSLDVRALHRAA